MRKSICVLVSAAALVSCKPITSLFSKSKESATSPEVELREGLCVANPSVRNVVIRIEKIGEKLVSFRSNVSGDLLNQYDKAVLEDEMRIGTTVPVSCDLYNE